MNLEEIEQLMKNRDHIQLHPDDFNRLNGMALMDAVPDLVAEVRRLNLQIADMKIGLDAEYKARRDAQLKFLDTEAELEQTKRLVGELQNALRDVFEISEVEGAVNLTVMESAKLMAARDLVPKATRDQEEPCQ